jgi:hypothetical protein
MAAYLHLDSSFRQDAFFRSSVSSEYLANDPRNNSDLQQIQTPTNYKVYWRDLLNSNILRTICPIQQCVPRPTNLTFTLEIVTADIPANALIRRQDPNDGSTVFISVLDEPYIYVQLQSVNQSEGNVLSTNNIFGKDATFVLAIDKRDVGLTSSNSAMAYPYATSVYSSSDAITAVGTEATPVPVANLTELRYIQYKSCMKIPVRITLQEELRVRFFDRYGNDVVLVETTNGPTAGTITTKVPLLEQLSVINPSLQTSLLVAITPNSCTSDPYKNFKELAM